MNPFTGDIATDAETLEKYSHDASNFQLMPSTVYYPKNVDDVVTVVQETREAKENGVDVSVTVRAGGSCMSGGPLNTSKILDMTRYMTEVTVDPEARTATAQMGVYFRDIEAQAKEHGLMFAGYPSSHDFCGIGGMIGNNASGEKSLRDGATGVNVLELEVVLADGSVVTMSPKDVNEATDPREQQLIGLYNTFGEKLREASGDVKKCASGYRLDRIITEGTFNEIPMMVGAQGTLGIVTKAVLRLVPMPVHTSLLMISAQSLEDLPKIVATVYEHNPEGLETFDINTFNKAREFLSEHADRILPYVDENAHLFILAQFSEDTKEATDQQAEACFDELQLKGFHTHQLMGGAVVDSAWEVRRNSFTLMRDHNPEGHNAVPCIEDVIVPLDTLGTFIHELIQILEKRSISYGFHGHIGDGSFRVIPVFDFGKDTLVDDIVALMNEVFDLIKRLRGNMSADHSDGIIRTPFLESFYGEDLNKVFKDIKNMYDPNNIINPNKKVNGSIEKLRKALGR